MRCASFFAGVGGIDLGFKRAGFETVYANEIDIYPARTYELNSNIKVDTRDVREVTETMDIPDFDILLSGFPCQPFSVAGYRQGFDDDKGRGTLFFEMIKVIRAKKPSVVFFENVKNLVTHNHGDTFETILDALQKEGYHVHYKVMNAKDYGIPQNRERIYIVGFKDDVQFEFPEPTSRTLTLYDIIDYRTKVEEKYYYRPGKNKGDIFEQLEKSITDDSIYQWRRRYVRKNMSHVVPTLTANMGTGGNNVPIIRSEHGIRKLTPRECFNAQGFPRDFVLPSDMSDARLYKQAGNSVCVSVIEKIAESVRVATEGTASRASA